MKMRVTLGVVACVSGCASSSPSSANNMPVIDRASVTTVSSEGGQTCRDACQIRGVFSFHDDDGDRLSKFSFQRGGKVVFLDGISNQIAGRGVDVPITFAVASIPAGTYTYDFVIQDARGDASLAFPVTFTVP
jgi:hypothetical protein